MKDSILNKMIIGLIVLFVIQGAIALGIFGWELSRMGEEHGRDIYHLIESHKKDTLQDLVDAAYSMVNTYYQRSKDIDTLKKLKAKELKTILQGIASQIHCILNVYKDQPEVAKEKIKTLVKAFRYHGNDYVWINDMKGVMIMHPIKPQLDGKNLINLRDRQGTYIFKQMIEVCKKKGEGMVSYLWPKPGEKEAKLKVSYVMLIPQLNWIIGTGEWVEDITKEMQKKALSEISAMKLSHHNYFWINNLQGVMLAHPSKQLRGKNVINLTDPDGKKIIKEMIDICKEKGGGFLYYRWGKKGEPGTYPKVSYVRLFKPWGWVIGMGIYLDDVHKLASKHIEEFKETVHKIMFLCAIVVGIFILIVTTLMFLFIRKKLKQPIEKLVNLSEEIIAGNLDTSVSGSFQGELKVLKDALEAMVTNLKKRIEETEEGRREAEEAKRRAQEALKEAEQAKIQAEKAQKEGMLQAANIMEDIVNHITTASEQLSAQVQEVTQNMQDQKERITEAATAMEEMNATVLEVAKNASQAAENSDATKEKAEEGYKVVQESIQEINRVKEISGELDSNMQELIKQAQAIGQIINVINDIADQTNLLALNAAIEAARAGEAGRGFAVVADEVRKLAENTMSATKQVAENITHIQNSTNRSNKSLQDALDAVGRATEKVEESGRVLQEIVELSQHSADQVRNIATAAEEQSSASEEITRSIEQVSSLAESTATGVEQSVDAIQELTHQTEQLQELIEKIKKENS